ncbi:hypothetical protein TNCV_1024941 [Trichonephila clavipes]|nr:hypothetical protein TNCV_1024941 [Trichonephila clavipes]
MAGEAVSLHSLLPNRNCKIYRQNFEADDFPCGAVNLYKAADHLSRYINNITIALPDSKDLINMQREDSVLSTIIQKIDQNDVSPQISNYFINGEGLLCHLSKRPSRSPRSNTTRKQDIMPSGLTVHRVLIAPRDSILQNVETVIQCSTWPLHHWRSPRGIQTHRFFISREISCIEQLRLYSAEDGDVMFQWTVVLDLELDDGRRDCCRGCSYRIT